MKRQLAVFSLDPLLPSEGRALPTKTVYDDPTTDKVEEILEFCKQYGVNYDVLLLATEEKVPTGAYIIANLGGHKLRPIVAYGSTALFVSKAPLIEIFSSTGQDVRVSIWKVDGLSIKETPATKPYPPDWLEPIQAAQEKAVLSTPMLYWVKSRV